MLPILYFAATAAILFGVLRLACGNCVMGRGNADDGPRLPIFVFGWALSLFLALTYLVCVIFDLIFPGYAMYDVWSGLLPGFVWLTPGAFVIGLIESFLYGWFAALLFGALFNAFANREGTA